MTVEGRNGRPLEGGEPPVLRLGTGSVSGNRRRDSREWLGKVKVLGEYIDHYVKEERNELFPKARAARKLDLVAMRDALQARKDELMGEMVTA